MANTVFETAPRPGQSCIDTSVVEQLKTRQKLVSKKYEDLNFTQSFLTSNYAWLRMVSGISLENDKTAAKKHQLLGGTLYDSKKRKGFNFSDSYLNDTTGAAYTNEKEGIKPMPGIVGFSVDQMGEEGLLRQINIQVQCHSLEQFSILEKLYMRPGYYSFIEWGHSVYVDKSGASITNPKMLDDSIIFAENVDPDEIKKAASKLVYDSQNNYDYIIAQIMNYEWSYNNGVYELDIQLIGQGGLSDMYKRMFDLGTDKEKSPEPEKDKKLEFSSADLLAGTFGTIMKTITETSNRGRASEDPLTPVSVDQGRIDDGFTARGIKDTVDGIIEEIGNGFKLEVYRLDFLSVANKEKFTYIPFRFIVGAINYMFLPRLEGQEAPEGKFATDKDRNIYLTFEDHYSINPFVCLLPKQSANTPLPTDSLTGSRDNSELKGDLLDIWINTAYITKTINAIIENASKSEDYSIANFMYEILKGIQGALGDVNDLKLYNDYYLDKKLGSSYIIDKMIPHKPEKSGEGIQADIKPFGKESLVTDYSFNTNIDAAMLTTLTAQAVLDGSDGAKAAGKGMAAYNFGVSSRFKETKTDTTTGSSTDNTENQKKSVKELVDEMYKNKTYNQETIDNAKASAASKLQIDINDKLVENNLSTGFAIPGNLSITMLGIGGLKRLEYFRLPNEILPDSYKESNVIFSIDKVSHSINGGQWFTSVDAIVLIP